MISLTSASSLATVYAALAKQKGFRLKTFVKVFAALIILGVIGNVLQGNRDGGNPEASAGKPSVGDDATYTLMAFCIDRSNQRLELSYGQPLMEYLANSGSAMMANVIQSNGYKDYCTTGNGPQSIPEAELAAGYEVISERLDTSGRGALLVRPTAVPNAVFIVLVE